MVQLRWKQARDAELLALARRLVATLAVPVLDGRGQLVAAISASGLTPQMQTPAGRPVHLDLMLAAAEKIASAIR